MLVHNVGGFAAKSPEELSLIDNAAEALLSTREKGYLLIVVSNQPDEALGKVSATTRMAIEGAFIALLSSKSVELDGIYYCYHHENAKVPQFKSVCGCRKPAPGLIIKAAEEHEIDLSTSYIIGDRATDIKAGDAAGLTTILFDPDRSQQSFLSLHGVSPHFNLQKLSDLTSILPDRRT